ncbi:signal-induced proliferation-associated 1-like protein 3 [Balamuthia mandrillaris]
MQQSPRAAGSLPSAESLLGEEGGALWRRCCGGQEGEEARVPFHVLTQQLGQTLGTELPPLEVLCLEAIFSQAIGNGSQQLLFIPLSELALFLKRFGPLQHCIEKVKDAVIGGRAYFHGGISRQEANERLQGKPEKSFLIRYSSSNPSAFSVTYMQGQSIKIFNGVENHETGPGVRLHSGNKTSYFKSLSECITKNAHIFKESCSAPSTDCLERYKQRIDEALGLVTGATIGGEKEGEEAEKSDAMNAARSPLLLAYHDAMSGRKSSLVLSSLGLNSFPYSFDLGALADFLCELDISDNSLTALPESLSKLHHLKILCANDNQLSSLPCSISSLRALEQLKLARNSFASICQEVGMLNQLLYLDVSDNQLVRIDPQLFQQLQLLEHVNLARNRLSEIPQAIFKLPHLQELLLGHNHIRWLPTAIKECSGLRVLDLSGNHITRLPAELIDFYRQLEALNVEGNDMSSPPKAVCAQGITAIVRFFTVARNASESDGMLTQASATPSRKKEDEQKELIDGKSLVLLPEPVVGDFDSSSDDEDLSSLSESVWTDKSQFDKLKFQTINDFFLLDDDLKELKKKETRRYDQLEIILKLKEKREELMKGTGIEDQRSRSKLRGSWQTGAIVSPSPEFWVEAGSNDDPYDPKNCCVDASNDCIEYSRHILKMVHTNLVGIDPELGPVAISMSKQLEKSEYSAISAEFYRALVRTGNEDIVTEIPAALVKRKKARGKSDAAPRSKDLLRGLRKILEPRLKKADLRVVRVRKSQQEFMKLEHTLRAPQWFRFGVLYAQDGQTSEEEMYNNAIGSERFHEFLEFLGERIRLKGWKKHNAGLDVKRDSTGTESYFTEFEGFDIMYHVSTLLPYLPNDPDRLERKRHIGNDVVVIVFKDTVPGGTSHPLPLVFNSHMTHVYVIVEVDWAKTGQKTFYRVNIAYKDDVPESQPILPQPPSFEKNDLFRKFLLTKLINAERGSYFARELRMANRRKRWAVLEDLEKNQLPKIKKKQEDKTADYYRPIFD